MPKYRSFMKNVANCRLSDLRHYRRGSRFSTPSGSQPGIAFSTMAGSSAAIAFANWLIDRSIPSRSKRDSAAENPRRHAARCGIDAVGGLEGEDRYSGRARGVLSPIPGCDVHLAWGRSSGGRAPHRNDWRSISIAPRGRHPLPVTEYPPISRELRQKAAPEGGAFGD